MQTELLRIISSRRTGHFVYYYSKKSFALFKGGFVLLPEYFDCIFRLFGVKELQKVRVEDLPQAVKGL